MNYTKKNTLFILSLALLNSPLWSMEEVTSAYEKETSSRQELTFVCEKNTSLSLKNILDILSEKNKILERGKTSDSNNYSNNYANNLFQFIGIINRFYEGLPCSFPYEIKQYIGHLLSCVAFEKDLRYEFSFFKTVKKHSDPVTSVACRFDDKTFVTETSDGRICLHDTGTGEIIKELSKSSMRVKLTALSPDGQKFVRVLEDGTARLLDADTGALLTELEKFYLETTSLFVFSPNGEIIITGSIYGIIHSLNSATGKVIEQLCIYEPIFSIIFAPDSQTVIIVAACVDPYLWNPKTGETERLKNNVFPLALSSDGKTSLMKVEGEINVHEIRTGRLKVKIEPPTILPDAFLFAVFSPDSQVFMMVSEQGEAWLWDAGTGKLIMELGSHGPLRVLTFSRDGKTIIMGLKNSQICLWKSLSCEAINWFSNHANFFQGWFVSRILKEKRTTGKCVFKENSLEQHIFNSLPEWVRNHVLQWNNIKFIAHTCQSS